MICKGVVCLFMLWIGVDSFRLLFLLFLGYVVRKVFFLCLEDDNIKKGWFFLLFLSKTYFIVSRKFSILLEIIFKQKLLALSDVFIFLAKVLPWIDLEHGAFQ